MDWSEIVRKATNLAEAKGYITFDELDLMLPHNVSSEGVESVMIALSDEGIWLQEQ